MAWELPPFAYVAPSRVRGDIRFSGLSGSPWRGLIPLHSLGYGPVNKAVHGLAAGLCVGLNRILLAFGNC